ncbi:hypothetical protein, partial [Streptomyces hirsutus]|uniref:hypothetical protein n=1 Tax=Streptomyces hirsutus TaxID=35620 RepID=UPI0033341D31
AFGPVADKSAAERTMWVLSSPVSLLLGVVLALRPDLGDGGLIVRGGCLYLLRQAVRGLLGS